MWTQKRTYTVRRHETRSLRRHIRRGWNGHTPRGEKGRRDTHREGIVKYGEGTRTERGNTRRADTYREETTQRRKKGNTRRRDIYREETHTERTERRQRRLHTAQRGEKRHIRKGDDYRNRGLVGKRDYEGTETTRKRNITTRRRDYIQGKSTTHMEKRKNIDGKETNLERD